MPLDDRLRQALSRSAADVHPDVERHLERVMQRARSHTRRRWLVGSLAVAAAIVAVVVVDLGVIQNPPTPAAAAVEGRYTAQVDQSETLLDERQMGGDWSLQFDTGGIVEVTAPSSYRGILSTVLYHVSGDSLRINLFETDLCSGEGLGTYTWQTSNGTLHFTVGEDTCAERVALLTEREWRKGD